MPRRGAAVHTIASQVRFLLIEPWLVWLAPSFVFACRILAENQLHLHAWTLERSPPPSDSPRTEPPAGWGGSLPPAGASVPHAESGGSVAGDSVCGTRCGGVGDGTDRESAPAIRGENPGASAPMADSPRDPTCSSRSDAPLTLKYAPNYQSYSLIRI